MENLSVFEQFIKHIKSRFNCDIEAFIPTARDDHICL